ncbi:hypothetical protein KC19_3G240200 [Ceratodon purpureus]|uniref:Uncharacterized protein n=1 Tax=Ceratodon purpureus TaxID=3225 RepID=A0A8T0IM90_CERPU|nr:hypothetical protein KC19_3G240200 [Ceratodon purpureus]
MRNVIAGSIHPQLADAPARNTWAFTRKWGLDCVTQKKYLRRSTMHIHFNLQVPVCSSFEMATQYKRAINILCLMKIFGDCALPVGTSKYCLLLKVRHLQLPNPFAEVWEIFLQSTRIILRMSGFWRYPKRRYTVTVVDESWTKLHHAVAPIR